MRGRIDIHGDLLIWRGKGWKYQRCPYGGIDHQGNCGDWCPLFGEPVRYSEEVADLIICSRTIFFVSLIDEREKGEGE